MSNLKEGYNPWEIILLQERKKKSKKANDALPKTIGHCKTAAIQPILWFRIYENSCD